MKWKLFSIMAALTLVLVACNGNTGTSDTDGNRNNDDGNVENTRYETDNGKNDTNYQNRDNTDKRGNVRNTRDNTGAIDNDNRKRNTKRGNNEYELATEAADKITDKVDDVDHAYVMKTKNNAYVAAQLNEKNDQNMNNRHTTDDGNNTDADRNNTNADRNNMNNKGHEHEVTHDVKDEITDIVKSVDSDVDHVYVSSNPDFFELAGDYADKSGNGKPVRGLFDEMGNMIERVFPQQGNR